MNFSIHYQNVTVNESLTSYEEKEQVSTLELESLNTIFSYSKEIVTSAEPINIQNSANITNLIHANLPISHPTLRQLADDMRTIKGDTKVFNRLFSHIHFDKLTAKRHKLESTKTYLAKANLFRYITLYLSKPQVSTESKQKLEKIYKSLLIGYYTSHFFENIKLLKRVLIIKSRKSALLIQEQAILKAEAYKNISQKSTRELEQQIDLEVNKGIGYIRRQIDKLGLLDNIIIDGGYCRKEWGHAMLYEIEKQENGLYRFIVYNTGDGSQKFHRKKSFFSDKLETALVFPNLSYDKVVSASLWDKLIRLRLLDDSNNIQALYNCFESLGSSEPTYKFQSPQKTGTCAWRCLMALLYHKLDLKEYRHFKFEMTKDSINDLINASSTEEKPVFFASQSEEQAQLFSKDQTKSIFHVASNNISSTDEKTLHLACTILDKRHKKLMELEQQ